MLQHLRPAIVMMALFTLLFGLAYPLAMTGAADAATIGKDAGGQPIPADAVTTSGSGLDPDVSPANARMQAARIAKARGVPTAEVQTVIDAHTNGMALGFIGEPTVNVLAVNRALDASLSGAHPKT
jgi:K+-transporting ATPase KdpC subunit